MASVGRLKNFELTVEIFSASQEVHTFLVTWKQKASAVQQFNMNAIYDSRKARLSQSFLDGRAN